MTETIIVLGVLVAMCVLFLTQWLPMAVTALCIPLVLQLTGVISAEEAWAGCTNASTLVLVPLFVLSGVLKKTSFMYRLRTGLFSALAQQGAKGRKKVLLFAMIMALLLGAFMGSSAAAAAVMIPVLVTIAAESRFPKKQLVKSAVDICCNANGVLPFGTALTSYITWNAYLEAAGATERFTFVQPFIIKIPLFIIMFLSIYLIGYKFYGPSDEIDTSTEVSEDVARLAKKNEVTGTTLSPAKDKLGMALFFGAAAAMVFTSTVIKVDTYLVAGIFAVLAFVFRIIDFKEAVASINWDVIFMLVGTLPLSSAMANAGLNDIIADGLSFLVSGSNNVIVVAAIFYFASWLCTQFLSNRSVGSVFRPLSIACAVGLGVDPRFTLLAINFGSSFSTSLPTATAAQMLAFNGCGYTSMWDFFKRSLLPAAVYFVAFMVWFPFVFNVIF